jgi:hypothetical protein
MGRQPWTIALESTELAINTDNEFNSLSKTSYAGDLPTSQANNRGTGLSAGQAAVTTQKNN